jgi:hypothetical protein
MKTNTTISIDGEVLNDTHKILKKEGLTFSFWIERCCRELIKKSESGQD